MRIPPRPTKRLDQVRDAGRRKHYSPGTERSYVGQMKRSMSQVYFLTSGLRKVQAGMTLSVPAREPNHAISILGVPQMVQDLA